jgi:hypothetical protein
MKALLVLALAVGVAYFSYQVLYPPIAEALGIQKVEEVVEEVKIVSAPAPKTEPVPEPVPVKPEPKPEPKPEMPVVMAPPPVPEPAMPEPEKPKEGDFVPPEFQPIETMVANWTNIPKSAFPRPVKMNRQFEFKIKVGSGTASSVVPAGQDVVAVAQQGANLVIAPTPTSNASRRSFAASLPGSLTSVTYALSTRMATWTPSAISGSTAGSHASIRLTPARATPWPPCA